MDGKPMATSDLAMWPTSFATSRRLSPVGDLLQQSENWQCSGCIRDFEDALGGQDCFSVFFSPSFIET